MKYSLRSSFSRLVLALFIWVFLLTVVGRTVTINGCMGILCWLSCMCTHSTFGIFKTRASCLGGSGFNIHGVGVAQSLARTA